MSDTLSRLTELIYDIFDEYKGPVPRDLTARDVPQWDSLANVQFMVLVEQSFGIRLSADQIGSFRNVGDLEDAIDAKRAAKA